VRFLYPRFYHERHGNRKVGQGVQRRGTADPAFGAFVQMYGLREYFPGGKEGRKENQPITGELKSTKLMVLPILFSKMLLQKDFLC